MLFNSETVQEPVFEIVTFAALLPIPVCAEPFAVVLLYSCIEAALVLVPVVTLLLAYILATQDTLSIVASEGIPLMLKV